MGDVLAIIDNADTVYRTEPQTMVGTVSGGHRTRSRAAGAPVPVTASLATSPVVRLTCGPWIDKGG